MAFIGVRGLVSVCLLLGTTAQHVNVSSQNLRGAGSTQSNTTSSNAVNVNVTYEALLKDAQASIEAAVGSNCSLNRCLSILEQGLVRDINIYSIRGSGIG